MKIEANFLPRLLQVPRTAVKTLSEFTVYAFLFAALLATGIPQSARAADDPAAAIKAMVDAKVKCPDFAKAVAKMVKDNPKQAESILAMAVKAQPMCACEIVHQGVLALGEYDATNADAVLQHSKLVASVVAAIVLYVQDSNPELLDTIVSCAIDTAQDARSEILNAVAGIYNGPPGGTQGTVTQGVKNPAITPAPTPVPMTPTQNL